MSVKGSAVKSTSGDHQGHRHRRTTPPITFAWKERGEQDLGFIAEEVAEIDPLLVTYRDGQVEGVKYDQLSTVLVKAIKEQQHQMQVQQRQLDTLNADKAALKEIVCELKPDAAMCR